MPAISTFVICKLCCYVSGVIELVLGLVGPVSVHHDGETVSCCTNRYTSQNWYSSNYCARCQALHECSDWLAWCQYAVAG